MPSRPFSEFARHYDRFMLRYVDYPSWVDYVERIFKKFKTEPKTVLDLACGTGIPTVLMARRGYQMVGVDRSAEMLRVLEEKRLGLPIRTLAAEMTDFRLEQPVDAAISLYDSVNYLLTEEELVRCFACVHRALVPGGLFVFDMNTVYSLSKFWGNRVTPRNVEGIASLWQNTFDERTMISTLHLTFWEEHGRTYEVRSQSAELRTQNEEPRMNTDEHRCPDGTMNDERRTRNSERSSQNAEAAGGEPVRFEEVHQERAYSQKEVARCLRQAGFAKSWFYSHGTFFPVAPLTTRMMVVARRENDQ